MRKVNVFDYELDGYFEHGTIANHGAALGPKLGAERIGAGLYEVEDGRWVWPFHYHYGVEEWLYVVSGSPVLRDRRGERELTAGDFVCFPSGHVGAHTVGGPGRFMIFSIGGSPEPSVSVYPDSDKIGVRPGNMAVPGLDTLDFPREAAVDYWYGEGSGDPVEPPELVRPPRPHYRPHAVNIAEVEAQAPDGSGAVAPDGFRHRLRRLGPLLAADRLGATLLELDPGQGGAPYHCEHGREEWLLVVAGSPLLRHPGGEALLAAGDVVCFRDGEAGARRLTNPGPEAVRLVVFSTADVPSVREYLDSRRMLVRYSRDHDGFLVALDASEDAQNSEGGLV
ncbi:MAG TPA: cupin domain-containing protein [Solirubrobacteraceae bacterium]|nr:cupin domain-containing protein [Solirubrobacteraceae bacterium]